MPVSGLQFYQKETSTQVFFCKYCEIFKNIYFELLLLTEPLVILAAASVLALLLNSDNLLTGYEQLSYFQFNVT